MSLTMDVPPLNSGVVEVRYGGRFTYLDRVGRLAENLLRALGTSFEVHEYGPSHVDCVSSAANMNIRCSSMGTLAVSQRAMDAPILLRELAPAVWDVVAETLDVRHRVQRIGTRFWFVYPFPDVDQAWASIRESHLAAPTDRWSDIFGKPSQSNFIGVSNRGNDTLRAAFAVVENQVRATLPEWFDRSAAERYAPPVSLLLDLDYARQSAAEFNLPRRGVETHLGSAWEVARAAALAVAATLAQQPLPRNKE